MVQAVLKKILGTKAQRDIKRMRPIVARINVLEEQFQALTDEQLQAKTAEFRQRITDGETTDDILEEAFATVKNACRRLVGTAANVCGHELPWDMIPFDCQLMGAMVLHRGKIAEMQTGEGKTLVATMPLYLNALPGHNVHLVTVNDYLARRDSEWMGHVFEFLGMRVGCIQNQMRPSERREEYAKDITYGTNSEFGFDYLRDNGTAHTADEQVQRGYHFAIVDEIDSILIDEARTPLIISGPSPDESTHKYFDSKPRVDALIRKQRDLCTRLATEAKALLEQEEVEAAKLKMYQVHNGMPKNKQLMKMLEEPSLRRLLEQIEAAMLTDMRKEQGRELREELYFTIDEKGHDANLTDRGCEALNPTDPEAYVLPDMVEAMSVLDTQSELSEEEKNQRLQEIQQQFLEKSERIHTVDQLIRAYCVYEKDVEYVVQGNQVMIVDEFTGRIMQGRRWSDGLHQAIEAKEGVKIERETQTLATITIQNYFRMYEKLSGMTGTAETEADEFSQIYNLDVACVETNRPVRRIDYNDCIYKTQREKFNAVVEEVEDCHQREQPVLVGTISVDSSELLSRMLRRKNIPHSVLNAKNHEGEAEIVARAGQPGAVTIATNMAGRGTDIKLGPGVVHLERSVVESGLELDGRLNGQSLRHLLEETPCGLHVLGSERHESRRIDRQLRGRSGRQGDPGSSRFYVSLEDDLMRLFGSDRIAGIMEKLGLEEGQVLEHKWLNKSIENAQRKVEQQNFSIRKRTLEYDDVMNKQREIVYSFRGDVVRSENVREIVYDVFHDVVENRVEAYSESNDEGAVHELLEWCQSSFPIAVREDEIMSNPEDPDSVKNTIYDKVKQAYDLKVAAEESEHFQRMEQQVVLHAIDSQWQDYLRAMDNLRQDVGLRAYGQQDPLVEFKREAYTMFQDLMNSIYHDVVTSVFRSSTSLRSFENFLASLPQTMVVHDDVSAMGQARQQRPADNGGGRSSSAVDEAIAAAQPVRREAAKVGRNDPCPCGSGKKYKKCCGTAS
ncbi:MAG: preprotein translocase subunit SecA [Verrucomicrobia bacterium]|nr:preprotein translocase subunit SecA [Verrucomicrobiota bacterium]MDA1085522.1 preprotein translocase subunit SecA [Verrucomicrobiota bacterium]